VKTGVDSVRRSHNCTPLVNDSILYEASSHHSNYLVRSRILSHTEKDSFSTRTPQNRAEYFGAINYRVGENILFTPYNSAVMVKGKNKFDTHTYQGIADAMVSAWVHSPGHFKNMITADYQVTGLSVALDTVTGRIYATQKFAVIDYQYSFSENKEMFPYSNYVLPQPVTSFDGINRELIADHKYDFNLRHDKPEFCANCNNAILNSPPITLRVEKDIFILRVEDSDFVKNITRNRQDGFAVEIVSFEDYMCGNPAYYTKPGRRNGQLMLNGRIIKPVLRNDLYKGYKKRKKKEDVKFVPYIFNKDSVAFFKRFRRYKLDQYNFQYFEISLGKVPPDISGYWGHNLVYIQDGQICHIDYLTSYCGEVMRDSQPSGFIPPSAVDQCKFYPEVRFLHFSIPFEQGKSDYTQKDIEPFIQSISSLSYDIDSMRIHAFSSIEGDSVLNRNLQIKRAMNIAEVLNQNQRYDVPVRITTSTDWTGFYEEVKKNPRWNYLSTMKQEEILDEFNKKGFDELESILKKERRGEIDLYCTIKVSDKNFEYFLTKELKTVQVKMDSLARKRKYSEELLEKFNLLYECVHSKVVQGKLKPEFLSSIKMPVHYHENHPLVQNFILYGYEFPEAYDKNKDWIINHTNDENFIDTDCNNPSHIKPEFLYILIQKATEKLQQNKSADLKKIQYLLDLITEMESFYQSDSVARLNIDRLNFNLNVLLLNTVFARDPEKYSGNAIKSVAQLYQFYKRYNLMDGNKAHHFTAV
jgi:hypothetical protein